MKINYVIPEVQVLTLGTESFLMTSGTGQDITLQDPSDFDGLFGVPSFDLL